MKVLDILYRAKHVTGDIKDYTLLRLNRRIGNSNLSSIELLVWCVLAVVILSKLSHIAGFIGPFENSLKRHEQSNTFYQVVSYGGKLNIEQVTNLSPLNSRPSLKRIDIFINRNSLHRLDSHWWKRIFCDVGIYSRVGLPYLDENQLIVSPKTMSEMLRLPVIKGNDSNPKLIALVGDNKEKLLLEIKLLNFFPDIVKEIEKDQYLVKQSITEEVSLECGVVQIVFNSFHVSKLFNSDAYILAYSLIVALSLSITFYLSAKILKSSIALSDVLDLGTRNIALWLLLIGTINLILGLCKVTIIPETKLNGIVMLLVILFIFLLPSAKAWINLYSQSLLRFVGCLLLCFPMTLIPGV